MTINHRCAMFLLIVAAFVSNGCAIANKMSGVSEARAIQKVGEAASGTVLPGADLAISAGWQLPVRVDPHDPARVALDVYKY